MGPWCFISTRRPGVYDQKEDFPEYYLPKSAKQQASNQDLNQRIHTIYKDDSKTLPFFEEGEQKNFQAFVQKERATRFLNTSPSARRYCLN